MIEQIISFIKELYPEKDFIPLHEPVFLGNERDYLQNCIDSTFVSSVGEYVDKFEKGIAAFTGSKYAVATVNGTAALHISLILSGVERNDEVITQPLTFVATCNALSYIGAKPIFVDVDKKTLGLSPKKLEDFLQKNSQQKQGKCFNKESGNQIKAVVPMHTFGLPINVSEIQAVCKKYNLVLVEDAAESLGSYWKGKHTGTFGLLGTLSFNGNKTITTGGGGMILTDDEELAKRAKHITTTAKVPHSWEFIHDEVGYNYRMPNINAALGCSQLEFLPKILENKRETSKRYESYFNEFKILFNTEQEESIANYWLNSIVLNNKVQRDEFLRKTNKKGVMTRPVWTLMNKLPMFKNAQCGNMDNALWLEERTVNIPSGYR